MNNETIGKRSQAVWNVPENTSAGENQLKLYNSLTRKNEVFMPKDGKNVKYYICGPTVYDHSHMGHARAYLSFDIVRRVLIELGYNVLAVMNITDIDDKIIKRARQNYLFDKYINEKRSFKDFMDDVNKALTMFNEKILTETDPDKLNLYKTTQETIKKCIEENKTEDKFDIISKTCSGILSDYLDSQFGSTVTDQAIFDKLSRKFENEFMEDMKMLNVLQPNVLTRVSEYVPEVISYIQKIIDNGYAYTTKDGSVYFNTKAFNDKEHHHYAKLVPEAYDTTVDDAAFIANMKESEGELSMTLDKLQEKVNPNDFALWKSSKPGEPFWDSPWGKGRPGWHIECSVMSNAICGEYLDIHAGGSDLKFPHHDNEIAQCEAYHDTSNWVNYFLHCGTLKIAGCKMSKSLKNFITIREAMNKYTPKQIRILFLMHNWCDVLDYSDSSMERALQLEKFIGEFLLVVKDKMRKNYIGKQSGDMFNKVNDISMELITKFMETKSNAHKALCDNINTRSVIELIRDLVNHCNIYISECEKKNEVPNCVILKDIAAYIVKTFKTFGVALNGGSFFEFDVLKEENEGSNVDKEELVMPFLQVLAEFREEVRKHARVSKNIEILKLCDDIRDTVLPELGVRLEDKNNETIVKLVDKEVLRREMEQKKALEENKRLEKEKKEKERLEKEALKKVNPIEMFKIGDFTGKFLHYDDKGIPTHTIDGEELSKGQRKKMEKLWDTQKKKFEQATH
uniref:Cysteine--tRNA ligase, cytoplasmic n=1 Tax=Parastrongyloides trichosuri TaxID=131310 RepID=A0A0N4ZY98_PARTI